MHQVKWLLWVVLFWQMAAVAATTSVTQQASGYGATPQAATANALVNAARQALGVAVTLNPDFRQQTMTWVVNQNKNGNVITQHWSDAPEPRLPTLSGIESYQVKSLTKVDKSLWKASVQARVAKNQSLRPKRSKLESVVVLPFKTHKSSYDLRQDVAASTVRRSLRRALVERLTQSGQIRVLDRAHGKSRLAEQLQSGASLDADQRAKLGHNLGADLLLTGRVDTLQLGRSYQNFYGGSNQSLSLHARLHYRLVDVATGDVLAANQVTYDPPASELRADFREAGIIPAVEPDRLGEVIYPQVATVLANKVLNLVAPLQVLKVAGPASVYISGGEGRVKVGDTLAVVSTTQLTNPQNSAKINVQQTSPARLIVTKIARGYAIAKIEKQGEVRQGSQLTKVVIKTPPAAGNHSMTPGSSPAPISWE